MALTQLGVALGQYLDRPWGRQAVYQGERGRRAFTAAELAAIALVLGTSVPALAADQRFFAHWARVSRQDATHLDSTLRHGSVTRHSKLSVAFELFHCTFPVT